MVDIPPIKMVIWGMVYYCFTYIMTFEGKERAGFTSDWVPAQPGSAPA